VKLFICEVGKDGAVDRMKTTEKLAESDLELFRLLEPNKNFAICEEY
jgi:hypothetical protein